MRRVAAVALVGALVMGAWTGCTPAGGDGAKSHTLIVGASLEPPTLDPTINSAASIPQVLLYNVYETLVKIDSTGTIQPLLAVSWKTSDDRLTYTFQLRSDAVFATGEPVTSTDIKFSLDRIKTQADVKPTLKKQFDALVSVETPDLATVVCKLSRPSNSWLYSMTGTAGIVINPKRADALKSATAGSGPYQLKEWRKEDAIVLSKAPGHKGTPANFDEVTFRYFKDPVAMNNALLAGDLDVISNVQAPQSLDQFKDTGRFTTQIGTTNGEVVLGLNNASAPFNDPKIRRAVLQAIDRHALMQVAWAGKGTLIGSMVPPTDPWYEDLSARIPFDVAQAKATIAAANLTKPVRLRVPTTAYATLSAQFIQSALKEVGLNVVVEQLDFGTWLDSVFTKGDYEMTIVAHVEPRDIGQFADKNYYWHYDNPAFAALIAKADAAVEAEQNAAMKQAAAMLADDAAAGFLWLLPNLVVSKASIKGVSANMVSLSFDLSSITAN